MDVRLEPKLYLVEVQVMRLRSVAKHVCEMGLIKNDKVQVLQYTACRLALKGLVRLVTS